MRALLIVNPHATSTTRGRRDVIVRALASAVNLDVVQTRYRGDATRLAAAAASDKFDLVMTLGGDGTVNEAVNGLLADPDRPPQPDTVAAPTRPAAAGTLAGASAPAAPGLRDPAERPALAALPGGNANVFVRSLGLPADPVDAAGRLIDDLAAGAHRVIGLGLANGRYFTFNAGLGFDAEVVRAVEGRRADGGVLTPARYAATALRQYYRVTDRRHPAITIAEPAGLTDQKAYACFISNSAPWTYLGQRPVTTNPGASFDTGLDLMALLSLRTMATVRTLRQMLSQRALPLRGRSLLTGHDLAGIALRADRPLPVQLDGEYMGETESIQFTAIPRALRVIA